MLSWQYDKDIIIVGSALGLVIILIVVIALSSGWYGASRKAPIYSELLGREVTTSEVFWAEGALRNYREVKLREEALEVE